MRLFEVALLALVFLEPKVALAEECVVRGMISDAEGMLEGTSRRARIEGPTPSELTLLRAGLSRLALEDGRVLMIRSSPAFRVRERYEGIAGLSIPAGAAVSNLRIEAGGNGRVDVDLGAGVVLTRARLPCSALTFGEADQPQEDESSEALVNHSNPVRQPRVLMLSVFADRAPDASVFRLRLAQGASLDLIEYERRAGWIRVAAKLGESASMRGWIRDTDVL